MASGKIRGIRDERPPQNLKYLTINHRMAVNKELTSSSVESKKKKSPAREWFDSVLFAVVAATLIRWLFFEAFTIPTPSMENSLLVGDFLFVSKLHYGTRTPKTPLQVP